MSSEVLKKFGRYFLLDLIAQGGMAEIYRARLAAKDGAGRLVVVKRIQAGFGSNDEFLKMFKSEIKVTMGLNHPNIVQVYDFGEEQAQPFIAMEHVDGKNLRQLLNRFKELGQPFPVELASYIIEQSASGLHYAHTYKDKISGDALNVVHRDISPQNLLVSYEGGVKIIDFGIAKATTNSENTRAGVIKGKPSYLSPEQISGDPLDGRTDLFALGAVFWELLVGKKLFAGDNDLAVLKMIESCTSTVRPPSELNPNVPKELDAIVMKLLSKSPDKRYQTGEELQRTLRRFQNSYAPDFSSSDLSSVSKELFQREIVEDRKKVQKLNDRVEQLLQNDIPEINPQNGEESQQRREETTTFVPRPSSLHKDSVEFKVDISKHESPLTIERPPVRPPEQRRSHATVARGTAATTTPLATGAHQTRTNHGVAGSGYTPPRSGFGWKGMVATLALVLGTSWVGPKTGLFEVPLLSSLVGATLPNRMPADTRMDHDPGTQPAPGTEISNGVPAKLRLNIFPEGNDTKISVNGRFVDAAQAIDVQTDSPLELLVQRPGFESFRSEFKIDSRSLGSNGEYLKQINLEPQRGQEPTMVIKGDNRGFLTVRSTPGADTKIFIDGTYWGRKYAPFEMLPVPTGKISLQLYNATLDLEDQISVEIEKNRTKQVQAKLRPREANRIPGGKSSGK